MAYSVGPSPYLRNTYTSAPIEFPVGLQLTHLPIHPLPSLSARSLQWKMLSDKYSRMPTWRLARISDTASSCLLHWPCCFQLSVSFSSSIHWLKIWHIHCLSAYHVTHLGKDETSCLPGLLTLWGLSLRTCLTPTTSAVQGPATHTIFMVWLLYTRPYPAGYQDHRWFFSFKKTKKCLF